MHSLKTAAQTGCFRQTFRKALHTAAQIGCAGVEIDAREELRPADLSDTGLRQLRKMLDDLNLRVAAVAFPTRGGFGEPARQQRRVDAALEAMQMASRLGCRAMLVNVQDAEGAAEGGPLHAALELLAERGLHYGVQLVGRGGAVPAAVLNEFAESLPEHGLLFDLDPGEIVSSGGSVAELLSGLGARVGSVHATDAYRDLGASSGVEVQLGRGAVDYAEVLGLLEEFDYRGWLTVARRGGDQPVEDMAAAVGFLEAVARG